LNGVTLIDSTFARKESACVASLICGTFINMKQISSFFTIAMFVLAVIGMNTVANGQTFSVLYDFNAASYDPWNFYDPGTLGQGQNGRIYTVSNLGGSYIDQGLVEHGEGAIFSMTPEGVLTEFYTFNPYTVPYAGCTPEGGLALGTDGYFYGTSVGCFDSDYGVVFKWSSGTGLIPLHTFTGGEDGGWPHAAPVEGTDGNFYGPTWCGGAQQCTGGGPFGCGTLYRITRTGTFTTLYQFPSNASNGCENVAPLVLGNDGNFYGTSEDVANNGTVFKITPSGAFTVLYHFDGVHGRFPVSSLVQGPDGNFYGTTLEGGLYGNGVVFMITPTGRISVLHEFGSTADDGAFPVVGLVLATDGKFYGVTGNGGRYGSGTIFGISANGTDYSILHSFDLPSAGYPQVALIQHTDGKFYGLSVFGGEAKACGYDGCGTFYSLDLGLKPFVSLVSNSGAAGSTVGILGEGLTGAINVSFNGTSATYTVMSDTYLRAKVPGGAKAGFVTVKTESGTLRSNKKFYVTQ
jgi:uncharacterized repeat protein (TIGR03803 family)